MTEIRTLSPQEPLPEEHSVVVLRRFDEDNPRATVVEIVVRDAAGRETAEMALSEDGKLMTWEQATQAARQRAEAEGLPYALLIDRTAGRRARDILAHDGNHSFAGEPLEDSDSEDGERGADMRDRRAV